MITHNCKLALIVSCSCQFAAHLLLAMATHKSHNLQQSWTLHGLYDIVARCSIKSTLLYSAKSYSLAGQTNFSEAAKSSSVPRSHRWCALYKNIPYQATPPCAQATSLPSLPYVRITLPAVDLPNRFLSDVQSSTFRLQVVGLN